MLMRSYCVDLGDASVSPIFIGLHVLTTSRYSARQSRTNTLREAPFTRGWLSTTEAL